MKAKIITWKVFSHAEPDCLEAFMMILDIFGLKKLVTRYFRDEE